MNPLQTCMSALSCQMLAREGFVDECYTVEIFLRVYDPCIYLANGPEKCYKTNLDEQQEQGG